MLILRRATNESNYRTAAYEAITSYLTQATPDTITVVQNTVVTILQRMERLLSLQVRTSSRSFFLPLDAYYSRIKFLVLMIGTTGTSCKATSAALLL